MMKTAPAPASGAPGVVQGEGGAAAHLASPFGCARARGQMCLPRLRSLLCSSKKLLRFAKTKQRELKTCSPGSRSGAAGPGPAVHGVPPVSLVCLRVLSGVREVQKPYSRVPVLA